MTEQTYLIGIDGDPVPHKVLAKSKAQARYRFWKMAREAGYRVSLPDFATKWVEYIRLAAPAEGDAK